jgi:ubiquinone/menaquinone biosynthesis C-methylase UbiE
MGDSDEAFEYWQERGEDYDAKYEEPTTVLQREKRARLSAALELAPFGDDGATVGEIGVGSGRLFARLPETVTRTVGVDFSAAMIRAAREREQSVAYVQATAESLPLRTNSLDVLFCLGVVGHMESEAVPRAIEEMARVVRPGGTLILSFANARSPFRRVRRAYLAARSGTHYSTYSPTFVRQLLDDAGYSVRTRRYLTYSTGLLDSKANLRVAAALDRTLGTNDRLGPLAMTWVLSARRSERRSTDL